MKKIVAFAGSNSKKSINKELAIFTARLVENVEVQVLDLNDYQMPIYGIDVENESGIPQKAQEFLKILHRADGIVLSLAEHNGNFASVFKNIYDWSSRIEKEVWNHTPMLLMATSPGARGGASVLSLAKNGFPYLGGNIVADFSLPSFYDNFKDGEVVNQELSTVLKEQVSVFQNVVHK